jgi:sugar phosphate isomerase/epimerase
MASKQSRRSMLKKTAVGAALTFGADAIQSADAQAKELSYRIPPPNEQSPSADKDWWYPGAPKNNKPNLTPGKTPIRLSAWANNNLLNYPKDGDIPGMVKRIRGMGYTSATGYCRLGDRNLWLDATDSEVRELKDALKFHDLLYYDIGLWMNPIHPDPVLQEQSIKYICEQMEVAARLGVPSVTGNTGSRHKHPTNHGMMHPDTWTGEIWDLTVKTFRRIFKDTAGYGTKWALEARITTNVNTPIAHSRLIEDVGDDRFVVCLAPARMVEYSNYFNSTGILIECFDRFGELILHGRAKDYLATLTGGASYIKIDKVPPGDGLQDYETYLLLLSRMKWPRTLNIGAGYKPDEYKRAIRFIHETAERVGVTMYS